MDRESEASPEFDLDWGGTTWRLHLTAPIPGLYAHGSDLGPLLGLEALAALGHPRTSLLDGTASCHLLKRGPRFEARYEPPGWGPLHLTAAWTHVEASIIDFDLEVQTRDFEPLRAFEVLILSRLGAALEPGAHRSVAPRDRRSAGYSYDGRETDLAGLVTGPPGEPLGPWLAPRSGRDGWTYVEMAHPDDVSRTIHEGTLPFRSTRHALLGHDLERGVVLRARMRGLWARKEQAHTMLEAAWHAFLARPLPLTT